MMLNSIPSMEQQTNSSFLNPSKVEPRLLVLKRFNDQIREEFDKALPQLEFRDFASYQENFIAKEGKGFPILEKEYYEAPQRTTNPSWCIAPLLYYSQHYKRNAKLMPKLTKMIEFIGHTTYAGITVLDPGYGLDWHYDDDPCEGIIQFRSFYNISTDNGTFLEVQETEKRVVRKYFMESEYMIFRAKKKHRVYNEGQAPRYSVVIDVLKQQLI